MLIWATHKKRCETCIKSPVTEDYNLSNAKCSEWWRRNSAVKKKSSGFDSTDKAETGNARK